MSSRAVATALFAFAAGASVAAQSSSTSVVCVAGQCVEGFSNLSIGAVLNANGLPPFLLLPGQYSESTNPQLLHDSLVSSSASIAPNSGFANASKVTLPLDVQLQPGLATYTGANYSGQPSFAALPLNTSSSFSASSLSISSNTWASLSSGLILWDSVPDISQLAPNAIAANNNLSLTSIQSASCASPCTSGGICSAQGSCSCKPGFTGSSCEACSAGFFGPNCSPCSAGCAQCDDGLSGSGRCLKESVTNSSGTCNCLNGVCGANGQCACNAGWTQSSNGTQCAQCAPGFFLTSNGNCAVCSLGCSQCADTSGDCITCKSGFTQNANDRTSCIAPQSATSAGTVCPDGSFSSGTACTPCSPLCQTCTAGTSNDCVICGAGRYSLNGSCVQTDANGVCQGSSLVADNNKRECEACPSKCTTCGIPGFNVASTINQLQCTGCLLGFVLSQGQCVESCPTGTFLDPKDNLTCTACSSTCGTCVGSATFCLTCTNNQLASAGSCVTSCPASTFSSGGACTSCHPDCASCTAGSAFNQCASCPPSRPVLSNGRCLQTCSKTQFFDTASGSCQSCDSSCSSCSAAGPSSCLACSDASRVLRGGSCVPAQCANGTSVVPGLGACLSDLVAIPAAATGTASGALPSLTGLTEPTVINTTTSKGGLEWWQILLMALGCAFIALLALVCWRRRARKKRAQRTAVFARVKRIDGRMGWRERLVRFGERLFGFGGKRRVNGETIMMNESEADRMMRLREVEEARHERDMEKLIGAYEYSRHSRVPSTLGKYSFSDTRSKRTDKSGANSKRIPVPDVNANRMSDASMYTEVTGMPRRGVDVRQPVKDVPILFPVGTRSNRYSASSYSSFATTTRPEILPAFPPTPAEEYARSVQDRTRRDNDLISLANDGPQEPQRGEYWLKPTNTGGSGGSRNPFRR